MTKIIYVSYEGRRETVDVEDGLSVMQGAVSNGVQGIDGDCTGVCACATCKVLVDTAWLDVVGMASEDERAMLEFRSDTPPNARLSCQIKVRPDIDGLIVRMPKSQDGGEFSEE